VKYNGACSIQCSAEAEQRVCRDFGPKRGVLAPGVTSDFTYVEILVTPTTRCLDEDGRRIRRNKAPLRCCLTGWPHTPAPCCTRWSGKATTDGTGKVERRAQKSVNIQKIRCLAGESEMRGAACGSDAPGAE
jgi:hypothetical protein